MIVHDDAAAKKMVEAEIGMKIFEPFRGLMVYCHGQVVGAIIFCNYTEADVNFSCVLHAPIGMKDARYVARYVFNQLGCRRCTSITSEWNIAARRALSQLGFKYEGTLRDYFNEGSDGYVFGLLRREQKIARI